MDRLNSLIIICFLMASGLWMQQDILLTPEVTPSVTPEPRTSIFDYDICAPPCWMGITPDESTAQDVEQLLQTHTDLVDPDSISKVGAFIGNSRAIDPDTNIVITGSYYFQVGIVDPAYKKMGIRSYVGIIDHKVDIIHVLSYRESSLGQTLSRLGSPHIIRADITPYDSKFNVTLIYLEPRLRLNLSISTEDCWTESLSENMYVNSILYYSENAAEELFPFLGDVPQPVLTGYRFVEERDVPPELWEQWLSGEVDMSCEEAWAELTPPEIIPMTPTPETENQD
jgi:hypothetical protein